MSKPIPDSIKPLLRLEAAGLLLSTITPSGLELLAAKMDMADPEQRELFELIAASARARHALTLKLGEYGL